jgi:hypothetical protein
MTNEEAAWAYPRIVPRVLHGDEPFTGSDAMAEATVVDFWRWANSDLLGNVSRGVLAEYIVALAVDSTSVPRDPWGEFDVVEPTGITIEVKSAAYIQAWDQAQLSRISFSTRATHPLTVHSVSEYTRQRRSDVWVFALLHHSEQSTINPLDLTQWCFWVVPTSWLDARTRSQHSITIPSLEASPYGTRVSFAELARSVRSIANGAART